MFGFPKDYKTANKLYKAGLKRKMTKEQKKFIKTCDTLEFYILTEAKESMRLGEDMIEIPLNSCFLANSLLSILKVDKEHLDVVVPRITNKYSYIKHEIVSETTKFDCDEHVIFYGWE